MRNRGLRWLPATNKPGPPVPVGSALCGIVVSPDHVYAPIAVGAFPMAAAVTG
jgi:hypothetical protein